MTLLTLRTGKEFQPTVAERHLEAEVAHCVGGVLSPLLANIALTALDEQFHAQWHTQMGTSWQREKRRKTGTGNWRLVRYADLCRTRHRSAYAACRVMPNPGGSSVVDLVAGFESFSIIRGMS